jgi:hypothetical protein
MTTTSLPRPDGATLRRAVPPAAGVLAVALAVLAGVWAGRGDAPEPQPPAARPSPDAALSRELPRVLGTLDAQRLSGRAALRHAATPLAQRRAARRLALAHLEAADAVRPVAGATGAKLVVQLANAGRAYDGLDQALGQRSAARFAVARRTVSWAEAELTRALAAVVATASERRLPPAPTPEPAGSNVKLWLIWFFAVGDVALALYLLRGPLATLGRRLV